MPGVLVPVQRSNQAQIQHLLHLALALPGTWFRRRFDHWQHRKLHCCLPQPEAIVVQGRHTTVAGLR